jgi:hypothetical protein
LKNRKKTEKPEEKLKKKMKKINKECKWIAAVQSCAKVTLKLRKVILSEKQERSEILNTRDSI